MTDCFWCNEVFDSTNHDSCPSCAKDTHTKEIAIINTKEDWSMKEKPDWAERILRSRARFYQEGVKHGAELERERIIKLLIDKAIEWRTADLHQQANYLDFAIELIKGEQK